MTEARSLSHGTCYSRSIFVSMIRSLIKTHAGGAKGQYIDYDVLLDILVVEFEWVWAQLSDHLKTLFIQGDLNADGVLTLDEFTAILHTVSPGVSDNRIHRMFKAALEETQDDDEDHNVGVNTITPEAFVATANKFGFLSGDHRTYMPPRPLTRHDSMELRIAALGTATQQHEELQKDAANTVGDEEIEMSTNSIACTEDEWQKTKDARKMKKLEKKSSIHQSTHDLVLTKVTQLLAQSISRFGDDHPVVRETQFLVKAYNRDSSRAAFHKLTRVVQTLTDRLSAPVRVGEKQVASTEVGEEKEG